MALRLLPGSAQGGKTDMDVGRFPGVAVIGNFDCEKMVGNIIRLDY